ncbi:MAG TPA: flagellar hook-length control protein FliK [Bradyrhizobium sp.]|uniref:flagellar hook-length control protein FliK n=1 Tax=Bradyrhizobium sp. TaxID=376 RepID=UPI002B45D821|nr:flagellar hook-length control protein FliK [Bradyrhizobium sp.]HKO69313.1 flagellar hook-length control protein FliK [Bradyrhizobium sp.]
MSISVSPIIPVIAAQSAAPDLVLQPGSVVDAQVLQILSDDLVRIAIANVSLDVLSEIQLVVGQALQLAVSQTETGIRLAVVGQGAPSAMPADAIAVPSNARVDASAKSLPSTALANSALTPPERIALSSAAETAATRQQSLAPLFANLGAVAGSNDFPAKLQQAILQVLAQRTSLDPELTGTEVKNAFQKSGLFLEAALASESVAPGAGIPDLKAALLVLRQTLAALGSAAPVEGATPIEVAPQPTAPAIVNATVTQAAVSPQSPDPKPVVVLPQPPELVPTQSPGLVPSQSPEIDPAKQSARAQPQTLVHDDDLRDVLLPGASARIVLSATPLDRSPRALVSGAAPGVLEPTFSPPPSDVGVNSLPVASRQNYTADVTFHTNTPPPPFRGALPSAQPIAEPSITSGASLAITAHRLVGDTEAAIARQTLLQVASVPDRIDTTGARSDPMTPRWHFEIPFATLQGTAMAQFEISQQGGGSEVEAAKRVWRARFSLDIEPAGPIHALISLAGERTSVRMWAERPATATQLRAGAAQLTQALSKAELQPGDIVIRDGAPPQLAPVRAGHFLDRAL